MVSNGLTETSNNIQYNPTTFAKGKYAKVFLIRVVMFSLQRVSSLAIT